MITKVAPGIDQLSVIVEDILFEGFWDMPKGVTINSYVVKGQQTALIDGVCGWDGVPESFFKLLDELQVELSSIKYLVLNHLEPDHAGWIEDLLKIHQDFEVYTTDKGAELFKAFFKVDVPIKVVKDNDQLDLGNGKLLTFHTIPHVHWPDAMVTFDHSTGTMFSCDAFGSFGKFELSAFDDDYSDEELLGYEHETIRYYSNIIGTFSPFVIKAIEKLQVLPIQRIAPGHGLIWQQRVQQIIESYHRYALYQVCPNRPEITLLWGSMYGMTQEAVKVVEQTLTEAKIKYHSLRLPETNWSEVITSVWTSSAIILGMPTYEYKMFPPMAAMLDELGKKKIMGRKYFRFGSYGWSGGAQRELDEILERYKLNWESIPPHEFRGKANPEDLTIIRQRVMELVDQLNESCN